MTGEKGNTGTKGVKGARGAYGMTGNQGATGPRGPQGESGMKFVFFEITIQKLVAIGFFCVLCKWVVNIQDIEYLIPNA